jgi:hypothetical protein
VSSDLIANTLISVIQPLLDNYKPAGVQKLNLLKIKLGSIAPVVTGLR